MRPGSNHPSGRFAAKGWSEQYLSQDRGAPCMGAAFDGHDKLSVPALALGPEPFFTESLILAQDERWRRA